jgi:modulator of FtsH protease HflC
MNRSLAAIGIAVAVLLVVATASVFTVSEAQQALVVRFGEVVKVHKDAGLKLKAPFIEDVVFIDKRVLEVDPPTEQVILSDQKRLEVDAFARYRIVDPLVFYRAAQTEGRAEQLLGNTVNASLRRVLGSVTLLALTSQERAQVMQNIQRQVDADAKRYGVEIVDVRIRRADLPEATSQSIYQRMRSEREREAAEFRAQGAEQAQQIRSRAERERTVILAEAQRDAQILRGQGDQQAIQIFAGAFNRDPQFYAFYRSMQAYRDSLGGDDTTMVLSPGNDFLRFFGNADGAGPAEGGRQNSAAPGSFGQPGRSGFPVGSGESSVTVPAAGPGPGTR